MNSSYSDSCFVDSNTCPSTTNTGCSDGKDVTIECSKLVKIHTIYKKANRPNVFINIIWTIKNSKITICSIINLYVQYLLLKNYSYFSLAFNTAYTITTTKLSCAHGSSTGM